MIILLNHLFPATDDAELAAYADALPDILGPASINTINRVSAFLAQCGHESAGFSRVVENLNYSPERLRAVWPNRFNAANAGYYGRNPERIANKVYGGRLGNGDEKSGEGWKYRGRGLIQLTGKANYAAFSKAVGIDAVADPNYVASPDGAVRSAVWFWTANGLNAFADKGDLLGMTKRINGGTHGLQDRVTLYGKARVFITKNGVV